MKCLKIKYVARAVLVCAAACLLAGGCTQKISHEQEPNDSFSETNRLTLDTSVEGFISSAYDKDYYYIEVAEPRILDITVSPVKGVNHALEIWKAGSPPVLVKFVDDTRKSSEERFPNFYAAPGGYYIGIVHGSRDVPAGNAESAYRLTVKTRAVETEARQPNNSAETSTPLTLGEDMRGYYSVSFNRLNLTGEVESREESWYSCEVKLDDERPVLLDAEVSGVPGVTAVISLYDDAHTCIGRVEAKSPGEGAALKRRGLNKGGTYYVMICSKSYERNQDMHYTLLVKTRIAEPTEESEPNDSFEQANPLSSGSMTGTVVPAQDKDFFLYKAVSPDVYRIALSCPIDINIKMILYGEDMQKLYEVDNAFRGGEELFPDFYSRGNFYICVFAGRGETTGEPYTLTVTPLGTAGGIEFEPNDAPARATAVRGTKITGFISYKNDKDYFVLDYGRRIRKSFTVKGVADGEISVSVTDPLGYIVKTVNIKGTETKVFSETIDGRGYLLVEPVIRAYNEPYTIILGD